MQYLPPLGQTQTLPPPQGQPAMLTTADAVLCEASDEDLALDGRSGEWGFCAAVVFRANEDALEMEFFAAHRLNADWRAHPNSLPDWTPTHPSMRGATE